MQFRLNDVSSWTTDVRCVPTTLCAISGILPNEIARSLSQAVAARGGSYPADSSLAFNVNDWLKVIQELGGSWRQAEDYSMQPYAARATISEYLQREKSGELKLIYGENESATMTHVFPLKDGELVDTYTSGKRIAADAAKVPADYNDFRVKRVFIVVG
jgi:hypothetical protein